MGEKLVVGPINKGLRNDRLPFVIDNDSFPTLINAYQWRGRIKRKRGTSLLGRLTRYFNSTLGSWTGGTQVSLTLDGTGSGNLITAFGLNTLSPNATLVPGGVSIYDSTSGIYYIDNVVAPGTGMLYSTSTSPPIPPYVLVGTVNYVTGVIQVAAAAGHVIYIGLNYYPDLPVMGLEFLNLNPTQSPGTIAFDTVYSYSINSSYPYTIIDESFYKNPATGTYVGYTQKTYWTPLHWNGQDYQQFWTTNYQGAFWATNGVTVPFDPTNIGMQFKPIVTVTVTSGGPPAIATLNIVGHGLVVGEFVFINEVAATTGINFQTGYVITVIDANNVSVEFPNATIAGNGTGGIAQYLTNNANPTLDCIRYYNGPASLGNGSFTTGLGWVNFCPPLSQSNFSINDLPALQYYLVGAKIIVPFKDRLVFMGVVVQTSSGTPIYLQDTIVFSQNGTPYYTASFTGNVSSPTTIFFPILVPSNQTATASAYFEDQTGFGGNISAGLEDAIITASPNEDVMILGFQRRQARMVYTGNDIIPFNLFIVNSELGTASTFSLINMNEGVITKGNRGYILTKQIGADRIDLQIPDEVFEVNLLNNGNERVTAQRDFINEWIYFTYPANTELSSVYLFPTQTLQYNYRDDSYAIFNESYTTYGSFTKASGQTWLTLSAQSWNTWTTPWNAGQTTLEQPLVIGGNQQGFILFRDEDEGTGEGNSLYIQSFSGNTVTSPDHCLNNGDYIVISGCLGAIGLQVNGDIFSVFGCTENTFMLDPPIDSTGSDYDGAGVIQRMYVPFIQTKQFPVAWGMGRKVRIGVQQYLFTNTANGEITLQIYLSQNSEYPYNSGTIVPAAGSINNSLIYSATLDTSPELYTQNCINLPLGTIGNGSITSFTFDLFTLFGVTGTLVPASTFIKVGSVATFQSNSLGGFTTTGTGTSSGSSINDSTGIVTIAFTVAPTSQVTTVNFSYYVSNLQDPTAVDQAQIWQRMNTSLIGDTVQLGFTMSDEQMRDTSFSNQFSEIELHGFVIDVTPSQLLI